MTLHVGLDTFQPIREEIVEEHRIHREAFSRGARRRWRRFGPRARGGRRLVAVGTTATRVLETLAGLGLWTPASSPRRRATGRLGGAGPTGRHRLHADLHHARVPFRAVDALLTNFHLPRSTVLALTMAFAGVERLRDAYAEAIAMRYRFFSFGDAMLVGRADRGVRDAS